ncbi:MAG: flagellin B [Helicobacteraceae bacterium]|jgi:flagellin|nr:flagellin B [Helicobacteraceae bacterium]
MSFIINTNVKALNSNVNLAVTSREVAKSLEKLSSGLRINKAADDSSGMAIADSLRSQANALGQSIRNVNDAIGMIQVADKAMDEQIKILDTIKTKAAQSAQDSQNYQSRAAIQRDVTRLIEQLDNIAFQTSYNGLKMLAGSFTNKAFEVGAYSNEVISVSIGATSSDKIGSVRRESTGNVTASGLSTLEFQISGKAVTLESVIISSSAGTGVGVLAEAINKNSDNLNGIRASYITQSTGAYQIRSGAVKGMTINGFVIGDVDVVTQADRNGNLVNAINNFTTETGVTASIDVEGRLNLTSNDGRGIELGGDFSDATGLNADHKNFGRLTLINTDANDIVVNEAVVSASPLGTNYQYTNMNDNLNKYQGNYNLRLVKGIFSKDDIQAGGGFGNDTQYDQANVNFGAGVTTREGAMIVMDIAESAIRLLDRVRSDIGAAQLQLEVTLNNISVTQVNVKAAESGIRDVEFGAESSNFSKQNILTQSGSYALSQANAIQQAVLRLLQ